MVWDIIAIPVAPLRNRLKEDVIEACEYLNAWYINKILCTGEKLCMVEGVLSNR